MSDDPVERLHRDVAELRREMHALGMVSATMKNKLDNIERDVELITTATLPRMVSSDRYAVVEKVVFGGVGLILITVMGALMALVVNK